MHALLRTAASPRSLAVVAAVLLALPAVQARSSDYTSSSSTTQSSNVQAAPNADPTAQNQGTPATPSTPSTQDQSTTPTTTPDASTSSTADPTAKKLPKTASNEPLLLLLGCVALAGAGITSYVRRMRSA